MCVIRDVKEKQSEGVFVPVVKPSKYVSGRMVENAPAGERKQPRVIVSDAGLEIWLGESTIWMTDCIQNGNQVEDMRICEDPNMMYEVLPGEYALYTAESTVSTIAEGEGVSVVRVSTPLKEKTSGMELGGAFSHTELYFWHRTPLVSVMTYFEADHYLPIRCFSLFRAAAKGEAVLTVNGSWRTLGETVHSEIDRYYVYADLRQYDSAHPFLAHIALRECEIPLRLRGEVNWQGPIITSGDLRVELEWTESGLGLGDIRDEKKGIVYDGHVPETLFYLQLRNLKTGENRLLNSLEGWNQVQEIVTNEGPVYHFDRPGVSMELAAVTQPQLHRVEWEIDVRIRDKDLTVIRVNPPAARMNLQQDTVRFIPYGSGQAMPISARRESYVANPYPSMLDLQYLAAWNSEAGRGLYCGFHDILGSHKVELSECHDGALRMETMIHAIGIDESRNGFHLTGNVTWQLFDGDWYDAALIYKNWVHTCAYWFTGVPSKDRDDVPEWMLKVPAWFLVSLNGENWLDNLLEARADLKDMPVAAHVYNWHQIPFDTNYPHYKPEVPGFKEKVALMQANDIRVMPYINGRLWDMQDRGDEDYQFTKVAKPAATKDRTGRVWSESYGSKNAKGELRKLAVMCPSTAVWQEKMIEINKWLLQDLGVDAVYLDQISAAQNINCMDPSHAHRKGGGSWWYDYYYHMMDHLKLLCNKEQGFTSECTAETYVGHIGGMLSWKWDMEYGVPAYSVIYAGYQPLFGRLFGTLEDTDTFRILVAQSLCFGDQMGWMDPKLYLNNPYRKFYFDLVHLRWQYNEYFYAGSCLRPPKLEGDLGMLSGYQITTEGMLSAMWEKWQDNSRIVIVVNMTDERRKVKVSPEGADAFEVEMAPVSAIVRPI